MPKKFANHIERGSKKNRQLDWEKEVEAVIKDITTGVNSKPHSPNVVQIVVYESSV